MKLALATLACLFLVHPELSFAQSTSVGGSTALSRPIEALPSPVRAFVPPHAISRTWYFQPFANDDFVVYAVEEAANGNRDDNGDGDTLDTVFHLLDLETGQDMSLGLPVSDFLANNEEHLADEPGIVVWCVPEVGHNVDLNGDGDKADVVPHVYDHATRTVLNVGISGYGLAVRDGIVAFKSRESEQGVGTDWDGDGTTSGTVVCVLYDVAARELIFTHTPITGPGAGFAGIVPSLNHGTVLINVPEASTGQDLNGDGDQLDECATVFDIASRTATQLPYATSAGAWTWITDGYCLIRVDEAGQGASDLDGDGSVFGWVGHIVDLDAGVVVRNLGFDLGSIYGEWEGTFAIAGKERAADLNGDGDTVDSVVHLYHGPSDTLTNTGLAGESRAFVPGTLTEDTLFVTWEVRQGMTDLNGDGDGDDYVLHFVDMNLRTWINLGVACDNPISVDPETGVVSWVADESFATWGDLNGDGDDDDEAVMEYDGRSGSTQVLYVADRVFSVSPQLGGFHWLLEEADVGIDYTGDGQLDDDVLSLRSTQPPLTQVAPWPVDIALRDSDRRTIAIGSLESELGRDVNGDGDQADTVLVALRR